MKEMSRKQYDKINNIGFQLEKDQMDEVLKFMLSAQPRIEITTKDGHTILKEFGEDGSIYLEGHEIGKFASAYTESPDHVKIAIATNIKGEDDYRIMTWHFLREK
ncbi:hypothetical protein EF808_00190 [archaeon]|nr:MAG: hypothetical protein EF808_00190 [archaeon]